jgi:hypothetical protein
MLSRNHEIDAVNGGSIGRRTNESWDWCAGWWQSDRINSIGWAALFLWAALVVLAEAAGYPSSSSWWDGWGVFFAGAGAIVLVAAAARLLLPQYRSSWWWSLIIGSILLGIGLDSWDGFAWIWALILAAIGVAILRGALARKV